MTRIQGISLGRRIQLVVIDNIWLSLTTSFPGHSWYLQFCKSRTVPSRLTDSNCLVSITVCRCSHTAKLVAAPKKGCISQSGVAKHSMYEARCSSDTRQGEWSSFDELHTAKLVQLVEGETTRLTSIDSMQRARTSQ